MQTSLNSWISTSKLTPAFKNIYPHTILYFTLRVSWFVFFSPVLSVTSPDPLASVLTWLEPTYSHLANWTLRHPSDIQSLFCPLFLCSLGTWYPHEPNWCHVLLFLSVWVTPSPLFNFLVIGMLYKHLTHIHIYYKKKVLWWTLTETLDYSYVIRTEKPFNL